MSGLPQPLWSACTLMDIDGTVADIRHRLHFIKDKPKNWDAFFKACKDDTPFKHMKTIVGALWSVGRVLYVSGRPERCRNDTQEWLKKHGFNTSLFPAGLYMRADGDYRDDSIVKYELLQKIKADGYHPIMAFDDRNCVVKMWRENGIPCAQVAEGDF